MMRKMLFGIATGLVLVSAGVRADDNDTADVKVAADKAKVEADIKAVNADKSTVKAAHEQVVDDRQQLAKDRAAHDKAAVEADKAKLAADRAALKSDFAQEQADKKQRREDRHELSKDRRADRAKIAGSAASTTRSSHTIGFGCLGGWFSNQPPRQSCGDAGTRSAVREWPSASRSLPPRRGWERKYGKRRSCFPKLVAPAA